jgi:hypothetical protein
MARAAFADERIAGAASLALAGAACAGVTVAGAKPPCLDRLGLGARTDAAALRPSHAAMKVAAAPVRRPAD